MVSSALADAGGAAALVVVVAAGCCFPLHQQNKNTTTTRPTRNTDATTIRAMAHKGSRSSDGEKEYINSQCVFKGPDHFE